MRHQHSGHGTLQQLRVELCRTLEGCKQPPQVLGFIFCIADGVVLLLCQSENQASGGFFIERLGIQNAVQICLRCGNAAVRLLFPAA